eukprot:5975969-Heterocapsa_arctica.AAC.1
MNELKKSRRRKSKLFVERSAFATKEKLWGCVSDGMKVDMKSENEIAKVRKETGPPWHDDLTGQVLDPQK